MTSVTSLEEDTLIFSLTPGYDCWIGINDIDNEGTFIWADGTEVTYTGWNSGEPNNIGNEDWGGLQLFLLRTIGIIYLVQIDYHVTSVALLVRFDLCYVRCTCNH